MTAVSVILPTFNRRDTIIRSLDSVRAQSFTDWELLVVDDGSTDGTADLIAGFDSRLRVIRQENRGVTRARNAGLRESRGDLLAFLDSDDEWLPHHLELGVSYLRDHSERAFVSAEFWEYFGPERTDKHYRIELEKWYPELSRRIGLGGLKLPRGEKDGYLRVYAVREPIGSWGRDIVTRAGFPDAQLYRGEIFRHWRWGYLMALQPTVLRRAALERVGPFDERFTNSSDHGFLALLCRHYEASFLSLPTAIKHEHDPAGRIPSEDHLATGRHRVDAARDMLRWFEELHLNEAPQDAELKAIHAYRRFWLAKLLVEEGKPGQAFPLLHAIGRDFPSLWEARVFAASLRIAPRTRWPLCFEYLASSLAHRLQVLAARLH